MGTWKDVVRTGYDSVSYAYRGDEDAPSQYQEWIGHLLPRFPAEAAVLDLGCGCGVPVARDLAAAGLTVTGVDISPVQIRRARQLVPDAIFWEGDLCEVDFSSASFDAVVCLYALIHLHDDDQHRVISDIARWLRPGGLLLATIGAEQITSTDSDWLATGTTMWWNHPDPSTVRGWLRDAGLAVTVDEFIPEGGTGHQLVVAHLADKCSDA